MKIKPKKILRKLIELIILIVTGALTTALTELINIWLEK